jgi:hypothetical protein
MLQFLRRERNLAQQVVLKARIFKHQNYIKDKNLKREHPNKAKTLTIK